jgi:hypothetical protein
MLKVVREGASEGILESADIQRNLAVGKS